MHSTVSDGKATPCQLVDTAVRVGLSVISVTDHNSFKGSVIAKRYARLKGKPVTVITGNEVRSDKGDVLVLCRDVVEVPVELGSLIDKAHDEGCLVVPAHPYDLSRLGIGDYVYRYPFDAIEVFNASAEPMANRRALEAASRLGLPGLADTDAHIPELLGTAYTLISGDSGVDGILEAIRKGRVKPVWRRIGLSLILRRYAWSIERRLRKLASSGRREDVDNVSIAKHGVQAS